MKKILAVLLLVVTGFVIIGYTCNSDGTEVEKLKKENSILNHRVEKLERWNRDYEGYPF